MTRPEPLVRPAAPEEVEAIADLWLRFMREHNDRHGRQIRATRRNRALMADHLADLVPHGQLWVLSLGATILGFAAVVPNLPRVEPAWTSAALTDLYVLPDWRGQGWGRRLLDAVAMDVAARGLDALTLTVAAGNPARALYVREGFEPFTETLVRPLQPGAG